MKHILTLSTAVLIVALSTIDFVQARAQLAFATCIGVGGVVGIIMVVRNRRSTPILLTIVELALFTAGGAIAARTIVELANRSV